MSLYRLLESWGFRPDLLLGHSIGELVAAHVAGVLSLEDACKLVAARARLMQALPEGGAMVALQASEDEVRALAAERGVAIAGLNGPEATVIAGDEDAVLDVAGQFEKLGRKSTRLRVSHAFHSARMDGMLEAFRQVAESLTYQPPHIPIVSNVTGKRARAEELGTAEYWVRHVRESVRFLDGMRSLEAEGASTFLELGPQGVLCGMGQGCLSEAAQARATFLPALRKNQSEVGSFIRALGGLHTQGHPIDWKRFFAPACPRTVELPTYAFQRERHWLDNSPQPAAGSASGRFPLAGRRLDLPDGSVLHSMEVGRVSRPTLPIMGCMGASLSREPSTCPFYLPSHSRTGLHRHWNCGMCNSCERSAFGKLRNARRCTCN